MHRSSWKKFEARVASVFGSTRTPLSGGNSKITRSDSLHSDLFLECKHGIKSAFWTLYQQVRPKAQKERKIPILCLGNKNHEGFLVCFHVDDMPQVLLHWLRSPGTIDAPMVHQLQKEFHEKLRTGIDIDS